MSTATSHHSTDIRFASPHWPAGDDAGRIGPECSAAYLSIGTDAPDRLEGHSFVFTVGRSNDVQRAAIDAVMPLIRGRSIEDLLDDMGSTWRMLVHDSRLGWPASDAGILHMAVGAVVNALWDLKAKRAGQPLWRLLSTMSPAEIVDLVDFRYLSDALSPAEAYAILERAAPGRAMREDRLIAEGYPAYTTTPGWFGHTDEELARLCRQAVADGFGQIKLKVGVDLADDMRRMAIARAVCGPDFAIAIDADQRWGVEDAITWIEALKEFDPHWVEEPTSPVDVLGHATIASAVAPIPVATGEQAQSQIVVKQLLQSNAIGYLQIDATSVAGVNENIASLLLAAGSGVPVCPHAGGVGLCEVVQHLAMFDYVAVSGSMEGRAIEHVDRFHEHFVTPAVVEGGRYRAPLVPGSGAQMLAKSLSDHSRPLLAALDGAA